MSSKQLKEEVKINANSVTVNKKNRRRNKPRKQKTEQLETPKTAMSYSGDTKIVEIVPPIGGKVIKDLDDPHQGFLYQLLDPNDEHFTQHMYKIPDGALSMSALLQFRFVETVWPPFVNRTSTDLTGRNYSALFLQVPFFRCLGVYIVHRLGQEFGSLEINSFIRTFLTLNSDQDTLYFPNWHATDLVENPGTPEEEPLMYFTLFSTNALRNLEPPSELGISATISQYRICGQGVTIGENSPDLFNQGTCEAGQFNINQTFNTFNADSGGGDAIPTTLAGYFTPSTQQVAITSSTTYVIPSFGFISLPSPTWTSDHIILLKSGTRLASPGEALRYERTGNTINIVNQVTGALQSLVQIAPSNASGTAFVARLYYVRAEDDPIPNVVDSKNVQVSLPPVTQQQLAQADVLSDCKIFSRNGGVYQPLRFWQPVFNMQQASNYGKLYFANTFTTAEDVVNTTGGGYFDSSDLNFGIGVMNFQAVPYAAAPLIKINRTVEVVPAENSVYGPVVTGCPTQCSEVIELARSTIMSEPHVYDGDENGLGLLFSKLISILPHVIKGTKTAVAAGKDIASRIREARKTWKSDKSRSSKRRN